MGSEGRCHRRKCVVCSVHRGHYPSGWCKLPIALVAEAINFFTTERGGWRRTILCCTGTWLIESRFLYITCRKWFYRQSASSLLDKNQGREDKRVLKEAQCVYMLSKILTQIGFQGRSRSPHDLTLAQVLKSQGIMRVVIDFSANPGVCLADWER